MFASLIQIFSASAYQCACCDRNVPLATYVDGAFWCLPCARGEHRHPGWGSKAA